MTESINNHHTEMESVDQFLEAREYGAAFDLIEACFDAVAAEQRHLDLLTIYQHLTQEWQPTSNLETYNLGIAWLKRGALHRFLEQFPDAIAAFEQSKQRFQQIGDRAKEAQALRNLSLVYESLGKTQRALELQDQALVLAREVGDRLGKASALGHLGQFYYARKLFQRSINAHQAALAIGVELGDRTLEAMSLYHLGGAYHELSRVNQAVEVYQAALEILQALDDRPKVIDCLLQLGRAYMTLGQDDQVVECFQQAERICRAIGDRVTEQAVLSMSGIIFDDMGNHQEAITLHQRALQMALAIEYRWGEGESHLNLGEILVKQRDPQNALLHLQQARLIYEELKEQAMLDRCKRAICRCNAAQKPG